MDNAKYRKNVMKTLSIKPAKAGLKLVTKKTPRMNVFHAVFGIATEVMELVGGLAPYVSGASKLTDQMKVNAFEECGDIGYYVAVAAKFLKVKVPGSGKKVKFKGMTRTEALLEMVKVSGHMLDLAKKYMYGPVVTKTDGTREKKVYDLDANGQKIQTGVDAKGKPVYQFHVETEPVVIEVPDAEKTEALFAEREAKIKDLLENQFIPLFWPFIYETFEVPPANVFVGNIAKLEARYGKSYFDLDEAEDRDPDAEIEAMNGAAAAANPAVIATGVAA